jgi:hypothetical protein
VDEIRRVHGCAGYFTAVRIQFYNQEQQVHLLHQKGNDLIDIATAITDGATVADSFDFGDTRRIHEPDPTSTNPTFTVLHTIAVVPTSRRKRDRDSSVSSRLCSLKYALK